jgi:HK97 family phage prohead protease
MIGYKRSTPSGALLLAEGETGRFTGYASIFDVVDDQGDRVERGAFARSLKESAARGQPPALLWQHDPGEPIGVWEQLREDARGLACIGRLCLETRRGAEAHALMKQGALSGLSIGYRVRVAARDSASGVRRLLDVDLLEISPVTFPALATARVATVKGVDSAGFAALKRAVAAASLSMRIS